MTYHSVPGQRPSHLRSLTSVAALAWLAGCNSGSDAGAPAAQVVGKASFIDLDGDQRVSSGDAVRVRFDRPVTVLQRTPVPFELAVEDDRFGQGAFLQEGDRPDEVRIVLGTDPRLRAGGGFAGT